MLEIERGLASVESAVVVAGAGAPGGLETALVEVRRIREAAEVVGLEHLLEATIELELLLDRSARRAGVLTPSATQSLQVATARLRELVAEVGAHPGQQGAASSAPAADESAVADRAAVSWGASDDDVVGRSPRPLLDDDELDQVFREEAREHLDGIDELLDNVATSRPALAEVRRRVHTLKGAAGLAGFEAVRRLAHRSEDLLELAAEVPEGRSVPEPWCRWLTDMVQGLETILDARSAGGDAGSAGLLRRLDELVEEAHVEEAEERLSEGGELSEASQSEAVVSKDVPDPFGPDDTSLPGASDPVGDDALERGRGEDDASAESDGGVTLADDEPTSAAVSREGTPVAQPRGREVDVRISLSELDELERVLEELIGLRSVIDVRHSRLGRLSGELQRGGKRLAELVEALRPGPQDRAVRTANDVAAGQTDESELRALRWRMLQEVVGDVGTSDRELEAEVDELRDELDRLGRLSTIFQQQLLGLRTVPIATLFRRLERLVRRTAAARGKRVRLDIEHGETQMDRRVLDALQESLQHLVVNAVEHGVENPELRRLRGKSREGRVTISTRTEGTAVVLEVADDGAGVDLDAVRRRAVEKGLLDPRAAERLEIDDALPLLLESGFTTATHVGALSGRGVGLDVVRACVERMGGRFDISSHRHEGARMKLWLPVHVAISRAMAVRVGEHELRVPTVGLRRIVRSGSPHHPGPWQPGAASSETLIGERAYRRFRLADLLGVEADGGRRASPVLVYELGDLAAAIEVDEVEDSAEIVTKPLPPLLSGYPGVSGVTVRPDGQLSLVLDLAALLAGAEDSDGALKRRTAEPSEMTVLVVDDSLSVRRVLSRLLERAGWSPVPARDGVEALELLRALETRPVAMVVDIEMPRMNGYEFVAAVRERVEWEDVPILMLTSRSADEHREKAIDLGADRYLLKPLQRDLILEVLDHLVTPGGREP